ncbi:MAG TPA: YceI family protein [Pyrinomonadaceae bacterium]|jgi:polyisoprenoid-binding protein YceI
MKSLKFKIVLAASVFVVIVGAVSYSFTLAIVTRPENRGKLLAFGRFAGANQTLLSLTSLGSKPFTPTRFRIDPKRSDLMVRAFSGGVLWFKGHDHFVRPSDYSGEVELTPTAITPASLLLTIRAASVEETRPIFTPPQKKIINKELNEIVLEPAKYPDIVFKSTEVTGKLKADGHYEANIGGDLTLHGVTRHITIPADVTLDGLNSLRARGEVEFNRSDFKVNATSAMHGTIRVRDKLKLTFDIVATTY